MNQTKIVFKKNISPNDSKANFKWNIVDRQLNISWTTPKIIHFIKHLKTLQSKVYPSKDNQKWIINLLLHRQREKILLIITIYYYHTQTVWLQWFRKPWVSRPFIFDTTRCDACERKKVEKEIRKVKKFYLIDHQNCHC